MSASSHSSFSAETAHLVRLLTTMRRIRAFEDAAERASQGGVAVLGQAASAKPALVRGPLHLSTGQEAVAAGVCAHLRSSDLLTSTHRGHGHTIAKGADLGRTMGELFGRATGFNRGKGGSMHIADFSVGMLGANGVVADGIPIAVGAAHAIKTGASAHPRDAIVACFFGDGAINRGPFLEGLNWAKIFTLPVLFVCEDNCYSATTATDAMTAGEGAAARAVSLGIPSQQVDGNNALAVDRLARTMVDAVREGGGPRLLHAITYRVKGHVSVDPAGYRDAGEVAAALETDPIARLEAHLRASGVEAAQLAAIHDEAVSEVAAAVAAAEAAPWPEPRLAYTDVQDIGGPA